MHIIIDMLYISPNIHDNKVFGLFNSMMMQIKLLFTHKNTFRDIIHTRGKQNKKAANPPSHHSKLFLSYHGLPTFLWYFCSHPRLCRLSRMSICKIITKIHTKDKSSHTQGENLKREGEKNKRRELQKRTFGQIYVVNVPGIILCLYARRRHENNLSFDR